MLTPCRHQAIFGTTCAAPCARVAPSSQPSGVEEAVMIQGVGKVVVPVTDQERANRDAFRLVVAVRGRRRHPLRPPAAILTRPRPGAQATFRALRNNRTAAVYGPAAMGHDGGVGCLDPLAAGPPFAAKEAHGMETPPDA